MNKKNDLSRADRRWRRLALWVLLPLLALGMLVLLMQPDNAAMLQGALG